MRRRVLAIAVVLAVVSAAAFWAAHPYLQERSVRRTVQRYAYALEEATTAADASGMADITSAEHLVTVQTYLGTYQLEGTRLQAQLLSLEVTGVERAEAPVAHVVEYWRYVKVDAASGEALDRAYEERLTLTYRLVKKDGGYIVDDVEVTDVQRGLSSE